MAMYSVIQWLAAIELVMVQIQSSLHVALLIVGAVLIGILAGVAIERYRERSRDDDELCLADLLDTDTLETADAEGEVLEDIAERHRGAIAPAGIKWETRAAMIGQQWTSTLYIVDYPDYPKDGYLNELFELTDVQFDLTVHLTPKNQAKARDELQRVADDLQVDADLERSVRGAYLQERAAEAVSTYKAVEDGSRVFDQAMFITVRAETKDALQESVRVLRSRLREQPAGLSPKTAICKQDLAVQAAAPIGPNPFGGEAIALGGAVGALLASPHRPTILEDDGVEIGTHWRNGSPVVVDPFARENGFATITVGDPGSGKSFGAKQQFIRSIEQSEDRIGIILEPLNNWAGVAEALGGTRITIGGDMGVNPLEIKPTPDRVQRAMGEDASPYRERLDSVMSILSNYFSLRGIQLGDRRTTLETAIEEAYDRQGITDDIATHDNESPTLRDVLDILEEMVADPEEFVVRTDEERRKIAADATWLIDQLRTFSEGGRYENLGRSTEFDLRDEKLVYLDLSQQEGTLGGSTSLMMQLLITLVYERAKETDKEVVFVIDEARYLMQDASSLEYLEIVFRHHRHHDLSIRMLTQTVDEFFQHSESEAILDQCSVKQFHHLDGMDQRWAEEFGLNSAQMRFVQDAIPGSEKLGFSESLLGVDGDWRGIEVRALEKEKRVIDFDPKKQSRTELPGVSNDKGQELVRNASTGNSTPEEQRKSFEESLIWANRGDNFE